MPKARRKHALHFTGPSRLPNIKTPSPHPKRAEGRGHCEKTELCILVCTDLSIVYISFRDCLARLNVGVLQKHPLDWVTKKRPLKIKVLIMLKNNDIKRVQQTWIYIFDFHKAWLVKFASAGISAPGQAALAHVCFHTFGSNMVEFKILHHMIRKIHAGRSTKEHQLIFF